MLNTGNIRMSASRLSILAFPGRIKGALRAAPVRSALATALLATMASIALAQEGAAHWSYSGSTGPAEWGTLEHDFSSCAAGKTQSPIDIRDDTVRNDKLPRVDF